MGTPQLNFETNAFASQYATLRTLSLQAEPTADAEIRKGAEVLHALDRSLPDRIQLPSRGERVAKSAEDRSVRDLYWNVLDSLVFSSPDLDSLEARLGLLPEKIGGHLNARHAVGQIVEAMKVSASAYGKAEQAKDAESVNRTVAAWKEGGARKAEEIFEWMSGLLGVDSPPKAIRALAVPRYPAQGAITLRTAAGPLVVIGCEKFQGSDFAEALIHESIHALESASKSVELLSDLRSQLKAGKADAFVEDQLPHTLFFMIAAEATRRFIDPKHTDVGHKIGTYERGLEPFRAFAEPILKDLIEGKIDRRHAVAKLSAYR